MAYPTKVTWLYPDKYWDQTMLKDLLKDVASEIVVVPGAYTGDKIDEINQYTRGKTAIITSDEENKFPIEKLEADKVFMTYPTERHKNVDGFLPIGYAPRTRELVKQNGMGAKSLDWFFSGQMTHKSREDCVRVLQNVPNGVLRATGGFAQGMEYEVYMQHMCRAKVVPCPAGAVSPDSFRLYEALEAGCTPIVENKKFWELLFGEVPFPIVNNWDELPDLIQHYKDRPDINNKCQAWWIRMKRDLKWRLQNE